MIDIHCHILPGADDGPQTLEESIEMARIAYEDGIRTIVSTPHYIDGNTDHSGDYILDKVWNLNKELKRKEINIEILCGNEVYITPNLNELIKKNRIHTINSTQYLLIEFPMFGLPMYVEQVIFDLQLLGITPIIAHPERYKWVAEDPSLIKDFIRMGALCQINSGSITGKFGQAAKSTSNLLITHNMAHVVASDGHSPRTRTPKLLEAYEYIVNKNGKKLADWLFYVNPKKIICGEIMERIEPVEIHKRKNLFSTFKKSVGLI